MRANPTVLCALGMALVDRMNRLNDAKPHSARAMPRPHQRPAGRTAPGVQVGQQLPGNLKNALRGTQHAIREQHAPRYLAEIEYRFSHRFDLPAMIERLTRVALRTPPMPYRLLKMAENFG